MVFLLFLKNYSSVSRTHTHTHTHNRYELVGAAGSVRRAYCDIARGGWELALRVKASITSAFTFDSAYWENDVLLNEEDFDPLENATDAK